MAFEILDKEWISSSFKSETEANQAKEKAKDMLKTYLNWQYKKFEHSYCHRTEIHNRTMLEFRLMVQSIELKKLQREIMMS